MLKKNMVQNFSMIKLKNIIERINPRGVEVRELQTPEEEDMASDFMKKHYIGKDVKSINIRLGIFLNGRMIGIIAYGAPTFAGLARQLGLESREVVELRRLFIEEVPVHNIESQVISMGNEELKNLKPDVKAVVTYADPSAGHLGTIYQATNAIYAGKSKGQYGKHKYLYLLGNSREKKQTLSRIRIQPQSYPKRD